MYIYTSSTKWTLHLTQKQSNDPKLKREKRKKTQDKQKLEVPKYQA